MLRLTPPGSTGTPPRSRGGQEATQAAGRGHATRQSLEIYSRLALADAQQRYDEVISDFPV